MIAKRGWYRLGYYEPYGLVEGAVCVAASINIAQGRRPDQVDAAMEPAVRALGFGRVGSLCSWNVRATGVDEVLARFDHTIEKLEANV